MYDALTAGDAINQSKSCNAVAFLTSLSINKVQNKQIAKMGADPGAGANAVSSLIITSHRRADGLVGWKIKK